jgi:hypothetical protein
LSRTCRLVVFAWLITEFVLCRKSNDLSWEGEEPSAATGEEDPSPVVEESATLPQAEAIAQGAEATPLEATVVEGMWTVAMSFAPCSSRSPQVLMSRAL